MLCSSYTMAKTNTARMIERVTPRKLRASAMLEFLRARSKSPLWYAVTVITEMRREKNSISAFFFNLSIPRWRKCAGKRRLLSIWWQEALTGEIMRTTGTKYTLYWKRDRRMEHFPIPSSFRSSSMWSSPFASLGKYSCQGPYKKKTHKKWPDYKEK